eukprot:NODE_113_length_19319_cov_0.247815.p7 type:complete len:375 gc:universal NODE_113_length_19319_cov_0.247815:254-1378(+)
MLSVKSLANYINAMYTKPICIEMIKDDEPLDCFTCTIRFPSEGDDTSIAKFQGSKKTVLKDVTSYILLKYPDLDINRFQGAAVTTPLELLNQFKNQRNAQVTIQVEDKPSGTLKYKWDNEELSLESNYSYFKHHSYTKNKIAQLLLEQAAIYDPLARDYVNWITKALPLTMFIKLPGMESVSIEYKGATKLDGVLDNSTAWKHHHEKVAETLCGMANNKGGIVYIGVHDTGIVQGIQFENTGQVDGLKLQYQNYIKSQMTPSISYDLVVLPVSYYKDKPELKLIAKDTKLSSEDLVKTLNELKQRWNDMWNTPQLLMDNQVVRENRFVFQFNVRPGQSLYQCKGVCYLRREGQNDRLTVEQIVDEMMMKKLLTD